MTKKQSDMTPEQLANYKAKQAARNASKAEALDLFDIMGEEKVVKNGVAGMIVSGIVEDTIKAAAAVAKEPYRKDGEAKDFNYHPHCELCRYFKASGHCYRYPPDKAYRYSEVRADSDACGEFKS